MAQITRRRFLRRTIAGGALLAVGGVVGRNLSGYGLDPAEAGRLLVLSPKEFLVLRAACRRLLAPDEGQAAAPSPDELETPLVIDRYLAGMDPSLVSDVRAVLGLLEHGPLVFTGRLSRFTRLDAAGQDAVLRAWATSRIDTLRQALAALKQLAMIGYYDDRRAFALLGYPGPLLASISARDGTVAP